MGPRIIPRIVRGRLWFEASNVLFPTFSSAACAWSAADAHSLDIVDGAA